MLGLHNSFIKMLLKPVFMAILLHFKLSIGKDRTLEIIDLVSDLISKENRPTNIMAYVCWSKVLQLQMYKRFSNNSYTTTLGDIDNVRYSFPEEHQVFLLDMSCAGSKEVLDQAQRLKLFIQPFRWIIWGVEDKSFDEFYFGVDSRVFIITQRNVDYEVRSFYKPTEGVGKLKENYVALWRSNGGFLSYRGLNNSKNRIDLMGTELKISYVVTNPDTFNHLTDYRNKHIDSITKVNWILTHHLVDIFNATPVKIFRDTWGYKNATTSLYSGMIGDLQTQYAEIGGTPSFFTIDRIDIVDYITATTPTYMRFIFKAPPLSYVTNVFTLPFDTYVWYSSFVLVAVILAVLYVIILWEWKDPIFKKKTAFMHSVQPNIIDVFLLEVGAITQQGSDSEPRSNAGRIATIFTFIALMFLYTSYSANIVALLQSTTESIKSLEDLYNSRISLGVEDIVYAHYYFENAQEPIKKKIYEKVAPKGQKPNFMSVQEGIKRVQDGSFAFHVELSTGYKVVADTFQESEKCSLKEVEYINLLEPWLTIRKRSPYKTIFKIGMYKLHESGIQQREINRLYTKKPVCHSKGSNFGSAGLIDCYAAFLIFGIGVGCSIFLLTLEILLKWHNERKENHRVSTVSTVSANNYTHEYEYVE